MSEHLPTWRRAAPWLGLATASALVAAAIAVPLLSGWDVHTRVADDRSAAPWHGFWEVKVGVGTPIALLLAAGGVVWGPSLAQRLSVRALLLVSFAASLGWLLALALVDGESGLTRALGNPHEYLPTARRVDDVGALLHGYVERIPLDAPGNWPIHVAGHPPGMLLFFVGLVTLGLGGDLAAALVVTTLAATIPAAVIVTLRALDAEWAARRITPWLVLTPAAVTLAVSADAVMAAVAAWGSACLALAARRSLWWSVPSGLLFGLLVMMSYGLPLFGLVALGVLVAARTWRPLVPVAATAAAVVGAFAVGGFAWWEAFDVLHDRYWDGIASERPGAYWTWANVALLVATAGPVVGAGLACVRELPRRVAPLVVGTVVALAVADLSQMSRSEVERIWLPFVPWLTLAVLALPARWERRGLAIQVVVALVVQHALYTSW